MNNTKDFLNGLFYKGLYKWKLAFSKEVTFKYGKLLMQIATMEDNINILEKDKNTLRFQTVNYKKEPVMEWEIYRDMDKEAFAYKFVKVTCRYLIGDFKLPVSKTFNADSDQLMIFNIMMQELNRWKIEALKKEKL